MRRSKRSLLVTSASLALGLAIATAAPLGAEMVTSSSKTTTTTYSGTVSDVQSPSKTIVIRSEKAPEPMRYTYNERTTWVDSAGNTVTMDSVKNQPATIHYVKEGDSMIVTRVEVQKPAATLEKKTTTTTTEEVH
jgi:hypothetical protein